MHLCRVRVEFLIHEMEQMDTHTYTRSFQIADEANINHGAQWMVQSQERRNIVQLRRMHFRSLCATVFRAQTHRLNHFCWVHKRTNASERPTLNRTKLNGGKKRNERKTPKLVYEMVRVRVCITCTVHAAIQHMYMRFASGPTCTDKWREEAALQVRGKTEREWETDCFVGIELI